MGTVSQSRSAPTRMLNASFWDIYGPSKTRLDYTAEPLGVVDWNQDTTSWRTFAYPSGPTLGDDDDFKSGEQLRSDLRRQRTSSFDNGHDFYTRKTSVEFSHENVNVTRLYPGFPNDISWYNGYLVPHVTGGAFSTVPPPSIPELYTLGREGIRRTIPTSPEVNLATLLGELSQRLPTIIGAQTRRYGVGSRQAGDEYLNVMFGWKPLVNDLQKLAQSVLNASAIVRQMSRDSGAQVRRRRTLQESSTYHDVTGTTGYLGMSRRNAQDVTPLFISGAHPALSSSDVIHQKTWFSGAFTFHLSEAYSMLDKLSSYEALANRLLGTRITPEVIWNLTPWSWLIDWWSDLGTFFTNVSAFTNDRLVLKYGYVMSETRSVRTHTYRGLTSPVAGVVPPSVSVFYTDHVKRRVKSTPYGFDVDLSSLSPRQWSILAALGMTKGPANQLR